ncbi:hypothetical protein [Cochlodiniinecator piscidefendens]|uniref:hypothetical protein n=1 Tax=Cochlodiniinecator piscidefendens TaxID=2715756 RepID=UPI00140BA9B9|nr:hypothetical protein [Cochlodiniinecator piscidefendens]
MHHFLIWSGQRARYILILGCIAALFVPSISTLMRPLLPLLIVMVLGVSIARIDLISFAHGLLSLRHVAGLVITSLLIMPLTSLVMYVLLNTLPLAQPYVITGVLFALAPPLSSAAGLCFILGYDARRALEVTLIATLMAPLTGPIMLGVLLPDLPSPTTTALILKLSGMIGGGLLMGAIIQMLMGRSRIAALKYEFDAISAYTMVLFVLPLFDGVGVAILADPLRAALVLCFAMTLNFGSHIMVRKIAPTSDETAGALGLMWGNRNVALYIAALPFDPFFSLFVAMYQVPMYATPLVFARRPISRAPQ